MTDTAEMEKYDCVGMGICPSDYICLVERYPGADEKTTAVEAAHQGGGPVGTALCALARWGARCAVITAVGGDDDGGFVLSRLKSAGVDTRYARVARGEATPRAFVWVDSSTGRRAVVLDNTRSPMIRPRDVRASELPPCRVFHTDGRDADACLKAMRRYRRDGTTIVMDAGSPRARIAELIAAADHFAASRNFIRKYFGPRVAPSAACAKILELGPSAAIVTLGENGCVGATRDGAVFTVPGHRRENFIVDTTGAGDVFHGGYIYGLLRGWPPERCARFANAAAFLKCARLGGRAGIAAVARIEALM